MSLFSKDKLKSLQQQDVSEKVHTILVVDDEAPNRAVIRTTLAENYNVLEAEDGMHALEVIAANPSLQISMVISDQRMPKMTGIELLTKVADILPKSIRIIVSGYTDVESFVESINKAHIYQFILKPYERVDLLWTVNRAIESYELQRKLDLHLMSLEETVEARTKELADKNEELIQAYQKLEDISLTDPLTQLKNRRFLEKHIESDIAQSLRKSQDWLTEYNQNPNIPDPTNTDLLFFLVDLDHFKSVNDTYGHEAGDLVLQDIKLLLEQVFRTSDLFIRWGGEEFLVVARGANRAEAAGLAERLRSAISYHEFKVSAETILKKTCSIGYAAYPFNPLQPAQVGWQQIVNIADQALYLAKNNGRDGWVGVDLNFRSNNLNQDHLRTLDVSEKKVTSLVSDKIVKLESNLDLTAG